jgi:TRAP-type C4-dicarboxylate transport system permease small subunit
MKDKRKIVVSILEWGTIISAFGLIFTVILQIVTRRFLVDIAPSWTEEASRFFFIYTISFGAGLAQREGYFVSMDYFYRKFNHKIRGIIDLIISLLSVILFLLMSVFSIFFIVLGTAETSPSLGLPMSIAFASMLIMSGSILYYLLVELIHNIRTISK